jgi:hypothetical protein
MSTQVKVSREVHEGTRRSTKKSWCQVDINELIKMKTDFCQWTDTKSLFCVSGLTEIAVILILPIARANTPTPDQTRCRQYGYGRGYNSGPVISIEPVPY